MCIPGSNRSHRALPRLFATYIAMSAFRSRSDALPSSFAVAIPMLAVMNTSLPSIRIGCRTLAATRSATSVAAWSSVASSMSSANSSPPNRETVSEVRTHVWSRDATTASRRSPAAWPRLSLMVLNPSRSTNNTASI